LYKSNFIQICIFFYIKMMIFTNIKGKKLLVLTKLKIIIISDIYPYILNFSLMYTHTHTRTR